MTIRMPRGDIRLVHFTINNPDGTCSDIDFTEIYFTVKRSFTDRNFLFQKRLSTGGIIKVNTGDYQVKIESDDTSDLSFGQYKFDIQFVFEDQLKETFVGNFELTAEVTSKENE